MKSQKVAIKEPKPECLKFYTWIHLTLNRNQGWKWSTLELEISKRRGGEGICGPCNLFQDSRLIFTDLKWDHCWCSQFPSTQTVRHDPTGDGNRFPRGTASL